MFGFFKKKKVQEVKEVQDLPEVKPVKKLSVQQRRLLPKMQQYIVEVAVTFDGHELSKFPMTIKAFDKNKAHKDVSEKAGLKIKSIHLK